MIIRGMNISQGTGTDRNTGREFEWNNMNIHVISDDFKIEKDDKGNTTKWGIGQSVEIIKIKNDYETLKSVFGFEPTDANLNSLIGAKCDLWYNKYGKVDKIVKVK